MREQNAHLKQTLSFDLLIATPQAILKDNGEFIKKVPFLHIIVDEAHIEQNLGCIANLGCKRITLSTSKPITSKMEQLFNMISAINPVLNEDF